MKENEYVVAGYSFSNAHDYKEAKREEETVEYIKAKSDLQDLNKAVKLYHKLVERKTLKTVVGYAFLNELRDKIISGGIVTADNLPCIQVEKEEKQLRAYANVLEKDQEQKHLETIEDYHIRLKNSKIISTFLGIIIVIMIGIAIWSDRTKFYIYENKIIDKYATWEEELNAREKVIEEKESTLNIESGTNAE